MSEDRTQETNRDRSESRPEDRPQTRSEDRPYRSNDSRSDSRDDRGGYQGGGGYQGRSGGYQDRGGGRYQGGGRGGPGGRGGYRRFRRKVCQFCVDKVTHIDYKDVPRLRRLVTDRGKILKSRATGTCLRHQRAATRAIKRARFMALLPFAPE